MSVTNPEEYRALIELGAADERLKQPLEVPVVEESEASPYRYCSDDGLCGHSDEAGCRRTETIIKWEEENGKLLPADLSWGARDQFFFFEDRIYYYKPFLEKLLAEDIANLKEDFNNPEFVSFVTEMKNYAPEFANDTTASLDDIRSVIEKSPSGMPVFVTETTKFMVFETPGTELVTEINRTVLDAVRTTLSDYRFSCFTIADCLYLKDGKAYWTDLTRWLNITSDVLKQGISVNGDFYPFGELTGDSLTVVNLAGNYFAKDFGKPFSIITV